MVIQTSVAPPSRPPILWRAASQDGSLPSNLCGLLRDHGADDVWRQGKGATPFQHPDWLGTWWECFGAAAFTTLRLFVGRDGTDGMPLALAGWGVEPIALVGGLRLRRLQLLGQASSIADASPGEVASLLHAVSDPATEQAITEQALDLALELPWDDFRVSYVDAASPFARAVVRWADRHRLRVLRVVDSRAFRVDTTSDEAAYWASRTGNVRRALLGKRRLAAERGLRYERGAAATPDSLAQLFRLHEARWQGKGLAPRQRQFLGLLASRWQDEITLRASTLHAAGEPVSSSLNVDCRGVVYNLQAGFLPQWDPRLSLGKLHLGFEISEAFADPGIRAYDMLPGAGMKSDYKGGLATHSSPVWTMWVLRSRRAMAAALLGRARTALLRRSQPERPRWGPPDPP